MTGSPAQNRCGLSPPPRPRPTVQWRAAAHPWLASPAARDPRPGLADELAKERDSRMRLKASLVSTRAVVRMKLAALSVFSQHGRGSAAVRDVAGGGGGGGDGKASDGDAGEGSASHEHRVRKRGRGAAVADGFVTASNSVVPGKKSSKATGAAGNAGAGERQRSTRSRRTRS